MVYPSVVFTFVCASMRVCHFFTSCISLSRVRLMPWKSERQLRPWISWISSLILRYACSSSLFRSARFASRTRPLSPSLESFMPWDLVTSVLPALRTANCIGVLTSYHSLRVNGSTTFFFAPFLPFVRRLFLPTAIAGGKRGRREGGTQRGKDLEPK